MLPFLVNKNVYII